MGFSWRKKLVNNKDVKEREKEDGENEKKSEREKKKMREKIVI